VQSAVAVRPAAASWEWRSRGYIIYCLSPLSGSHHPMIWREFSRGYTRHARCSSIIESDLLARELLLERERQRSKLGRRCHTLPPACSHWAWGKSTRKLILATPPLIEVPRERSCRSAACWATQQSQKPVQPVQDSADTHSTLLNPRTASLPCTCSSTSTRCGHRHRLIHRGIFHPASLTASFVFPTVNRSIRCSVDQVCSQWKFWRIWTFQCCPNFIKRVRWLSSPIFPVW
jgi:hypothetical protein